MQLSKANYRLFNVCTKLEYTDPADNKQKTKWYRVGTLRIYPSGSVILRRFDNPVTDYYCFEQPDTIPADESNESKAAILR